MPVAGREAASRSVASTSRLGASPRRPSPSRAASKANSQPHLIPASDADGTDGRVTSAALAGTRSSRVGHGCRIRCAGRSGSPSGSAPATPCRERSRPAPIASAWTAPALCVGATDGRPPCRLAACSPQPPIVRQPHTSTAAVPAQVRGSCHQYRPTSIPPMRVTLPDGSERELEDGATGADLAASIGPGLARAALAIRVVDGDGPTPRRERVRRGPGPRPRAAAARRRARGDRHRQLRRLGLGPARSGTTPRTCSPPPCSTSIRARRSRSARRSARASTTTSSSPTASRSPSTTSRRSRPRCASTSRPTSRSCARTSRSATRSSASAREGQDYKVELIEDLVRDQRRRDGLALHQRRRSPTSAAARTRPSTKRVKAFKLLSVAGAYWRGDADRQMLTRIYGTAFHSKDDLEQYLHQLEEARARDHRRLGRDLDLFMFSELSPGSPFWLPPGKAMLNQLTDLWREENAARGYREVQTPILYDVEPVEAVRPLGRVPRPHVLHGRRGPADGPEADELPRARPALQGRAALLPRPADPLLGGRPRAPPRAERHAPRPAARPPHHAGRRPHLLHRGAGPGGGPALPGLRLRDLRHVRLQAAARALDAARQARRHRGDVGPRRGAAREGAGRQGRRVRAQPGRRRVLRPEDRPPHDRLDRPLVAARHRPARLLHARAVRARPTRAPTTPTTGR